MTQQARSVHFRFKRRRGLPSILLGLALTLSLALLAAVPTLAHGGGTPQVINAEAGPYRVSAWTEPDPIQVGELHITIAVMRSLETGGTEQETGDPVLDAAVRVRVEPVGGTGETLVAMATRKNAVNKLFYEADLDLPAEGQWRVSVWVEGPLGAGVTSFDIQANPSSISSPFQLFGWPVWAGSLLTLLTGGWLAQRFRAGDQPHHPRSALAEQGDQ